MDATDGIGLVNWVDLDPEREGHLVAALKLIAEYDDENGFPGFRPDATTNWQHLYELGEREFIVYGPEPLGTYGPDGREEYGSVVHLTPYGREEIEAQASA